MVREEVNGERTRDAAAAVRAAADGDVLLETIGLLSPHSREFMAHFYGRLLARLPEFWPLFRDIGRGAQHAKLWTLLTMLAGTSVVADSPDWVDQLAADYPDRIEDLASTHAGFGIRTEHIYVFAEELVNAMEYHLGERFTPEMRSAWGDAVSRLGVVMTERAAAG
jgi:nitric oxide dioxygenase